jgi:hypothetical protein
MAATTPRLPDLHVVLMVSCRAAMDVVLKSFASSVLADLFLMLW